MSAALLAEADLFPTEAAVLRMIDENPGARATWLAEALMLQPSNVTKLVNRLEEIGCCRRAPSAKDERAISLTLTPKGKRAVAFARKVSAEVEELALSGLSVAERRALTKSLRTALAATQTPGRSIVNAPRRTRRAAV